MPKALIYILNRFFSQIADFFKHWYVDGSYFFGQTLISALENLDRFFAFKITLKHLFQPLYQDRTFIGYTLGFFFRAIRIFLGFIVYAIAISLAIVIYLAWLATPLFIIWKIKT
ncbi:hypothetical protein COS59_01170 [Candidatus Wolfebacteria bacterium CG03_land_8_20_14_0_80_36_15]|uniref:Uncharacterized protein n=1 Tax=Candidatus Wolfebacteria bacterium CG03_land_8_20_14_0_80_36_15 TaxID=1975067 RepID=A0A2M7B7T0_9BACT|nr:MAG: hypothetical protein COS59_01170 [Candidatus Wolfebacteria bacterium CG03_land_8_20_14_0_80_36_15]